MTSTTLTKPQIKQLRGMAHQINPLLLIGKNNITETVVSQADQLLEDHELIKCQLQEGALLSTKEAATELADMLNAAVVQTVGHRFVLFRASSKDLKNPIKLVRE
ncbi:YhbY family RNA-binding protein [Alloscardovia venturai]|uniref:YhbY family RNA-binding protein n=1 Tax=Alloscardovia venturai TaxID=1769421 RepID=A0ABW2Y743_9BIFI